MIYFMQAGDNGPVKIGHVAGDSIGTVRQRLNQLQSGSADRLFVRAVMPGDRGTEAELHAQFADEWMRGEWFRASDALLALVAEHPAEPKDFWPGPRTPGGPEPLASRSTRVEFTVSEEVFAQIEAARGDVPRAAWIKAVLNEEVKRALESALEGPAWAGESPPVTRPEKDPAAAVSRPASSRTPSSAEAKKDSRPVPKAGKR